jgi:hypothetical protein
MNRIILIGNGFDLAHDLPTGYRDFIKEHNYKHNPSLKNKFLEHISEMADLDSWLGIENEYYNLLKDFLKPDIDEKHANKWRSAKILNDEFSQVKNLLEKYLTEVCAKDIEVHDSIKETIDQPLKNNEVAISKRELLIKDIYAGSLSVAYRPNSLMKTYLRESDERLNNIRPDKTLFLNFNYTNTAKKLYAQNVGQIINIHGELNSGTNPIIFGYGDDLDDEYKNIEKTHDSDFLENMKHIHYLRTNNYRNLLGFLETAPYQVYTMGHSCGNSDRTLLQTIFEHENCISVKPYYRDLGDGNDDYLEIVKNISRNFSDKKLMRDVVVPHENCGPLVPYKLSEENA